MGTTNPDISRGHDSTPIFLWIGYPALVLLVFIIVRC